MCRDANTILRFTVNNFAYDRVTSRAPREEKDKHLSAWYIITDKSGRMELAGIREHRARSTTLTLNINVMLDVSRLFPCLCPFPSII